MREQIGKKTAKLLSALEGKRLTETQYQIIAHSSFNDRTDCRAELSKLRSRGFVHMDLIDGIYHHYLSPKGQHTLNEYRR